MGPQPSHPRLPPAPPQMLLLLTRPQGASRARSPGSRCRLPPSPSGASAPGSTERLALPARQGCPPYPHSTGALPTALPRVPKAPLSSRANISPAYCQPSPNEVPPHPSKAGPAGEEAPCRGPRWENSFISSAKACCYLIAGMERFPMKPNSQPSPPREQKLCTPAGLSWSQKQGSFELRSWGSLGRVSLLPLRHLPAHTHAHTHTLVQVP